MRASWSSSLVQHLIKAFGGHRKITGRQCVKPIPARLHFQRKRHFRGSALFIDRLTRVVHYKCVDDKLGDTGNAAEKKFREPKLSGVAQNGESLIERI